MSDINRRDFLKFVGAGGVGAGAGFYLADASKKTVEYLIPQVVPPEDYVPGVASWYNTVCTQCDAACGISVRTKEGRAKKIEGNANHPVNQGGLCARGQAGLNALYNPDRVRTPLLLEGGRYREISWDRALTELGRRISSLRIQNQIDKVSVLSNTQSGHIGELLDRFIQLLGTDHYAQYSVTAPHAIQEANRISFGEPTLPYYDIANADVVVSFGADYLGTWLSPVHYSKAYGKLRQGRDHRGTTVQFESRMSLTGANADEWHAPNPGSEGLLAMAMANVVSRSSAVADAGAWSQSLSAYAPSRVAEQIGIDADKIEAVANAFASGNGLALAGGSALAGTNGVAVQVAVNVLNYLGGAIGREGGVIFNSDGPASKAASFAQLTEFAQQLGDRGTEVLMLLDANPVYDLPQSAGFSAAIENVPFVVSVNSFLDESSAMADLVLPLDTYLEAWSDASPNPGVGFSVSSIAQPVVQRVFDTKSLGDIVLGLSAQIGSELPIELPWTSAEEYLRGVWLDNYLAAEPGGNEKSFETFWRSVLSAGVVGQRPASVGGANVSLNSSATSGMDFGVGDFSGSESERPFVFQPYESVMMGVGRTANSPWLQETPDPLTSIVYGSWVELNPATAKELGIREGDLLEVASDSGTLTAPAFLYPGIRPDVIAMPMGQGHTEYGRYAKDRGVSPTRILSDLTDSRTGALATAATRVSISKTGERHGLIKNDGITRTLGRQILGPHSGGH
ncbi:MAG: molybdopterin-dependent oxidoreductase [Pseudomonadota bacterium]